MNPTDTADTTMDESIYHNYYLYENIPKPCTKEGVKAFGGLFLPPLYSLVFLFGLLGNSVVVLVLFKYKRLKSMTDVYLLNLAISDLLFVFSLPFWGYYAADQWVFGLGLCKIISWMYLVGFYSGIFFVMLMSIDRYLAIVHAVFSLRARTLTYGVITSLATWSVAVLASLPGFLFSTCYTERNHTYCKTKYSLNSTRWKVLSSLEINILGLVIPLGTMLFCYSMIIRTLQHRYATMSHVSEFNLVCTVSAATGKLPHDNLKVYGPFRTSSLSLSPSHTPTTEGTVCSAFSHCSQETFSTENLLTGRVLAGVLCTC